MQTTKEKLNALTKRVLAADEALKRAYNLSTKIAVKEAEITALEAGLPSCPEGRTKAGLERRIKTLKSSVEALSTELGRAERIAESVLDLAQPWTPIEKVPPFDSSDGPTAYAQGAEPEQTAATSTEGEDDYAWVADGVAEVERAAKALLALKDACHELKN
jgi:hypothetical protein